MTHFKKILFYGFLSWLIPFVLSFFLYSKEGDLLINMDVFKSMMVVVSVSTAMLLLIQYFKVIKSNYLRNAGYLGLTWFVLNLILDILILLPLSQIPMQDYVNQIAIRYLAIPVMAMGVGYILEKKLR